MLTSIIYSIRFATTGYIKQLQNDTKSVPKRERERENALMPVTI